MIVENILTTEEPEVPTIAVIPYKMSYLQKGWYHGVYFMQYCIKVGGVNRKYEQVYMYPYPDE